MNQKNRIIMATVTSLLAALMLGGCGSGNKEGASQGADSSPLFGNVPVVGDTGCTQCHSAVTEALTGEGLITQYQLYSPHNVSGLGCESCHGGALGHPDPLNKPPFPLMGSTPNEKGARCATCHDGVQSLTVNGVPTVPRATNSNNFEASNHYVGTPSHLDSGVTCTRCHTHEGAVLGNIIGWTGTKDVLDDTTIQAKLPIINTYTGFKCETCHQHGGGLRVVKGTDSAAAGNVVNWDPNNNRKTDQFDICTSCHNIYNYNGSLLLVDGNAQGGVATGIVGHHETSWYRIIASTHYDNPNTPGETLAGVPGKVEGYNLRKTGENPCFDCHGHEAKTETRTAGTTPANATIYTDWAQSAHAGKLLAAKYTATTGLSGAAQVAAAMSAGSIDDVTVGGPGWTHYNWDDTASRGSCQRCHTATGASNYMTAPAAYASANNDFSHLSGWSASGGSPQNELLYCWGCHSNAGTGTLRNPGAITEAYGDVGDPTTTISYPDISGSNVCMTCHLGREIGAVIKSDPDADGVRSFINSHYLTAGGQLFGTTGYQYDGRSYANPTFFAHDKVGSAAAPGTGANGPCAGCHMQTPNSHSFLPVTKDGTGAITAITSTACATCHTGGFALTPAGLTTEEEEYQAAISALMSVLASKGIHFFEAHPYFYQGAGGTGGAFTNWASIYGLALWKDVMGAAFNANLLIHDPGGYAHNRFYSKRLLWDSIDFIYDGVLNDDVTAAIDAVVTDPTTAAAAKDYLGTARP